MVTLESKTERQAAFGPRRARWVEIGEAHAAAFAIDPMALAHFETFDRFYRALCALLFNYVPTSGHPGGSISSGRYVAALLFAEMEYDLSDPDRDDADILSYAAGHKALGLYAMWALRNEVARLGAPGLLPADPRHQFRLEDLLGFRKNPITATSQFMNHHARALDGHPTPATPFVRLATGASGVGLAASLGLAWAAADTYGDAAPRVHIVEGEGGLTPGRVAEALAAAGTAGLSNAILHVDWNQSSIDSNHVCREADQPGDYVQWTPMELAYLHDWNVIHVTDGLDLRQIMVAHRMAVAMDTGQPTAIVYRTVKGWRYGIEGRASHGAGHPLCSDGYYRAVAPIEREAGVGIPRCDPAAPRCGAGSDAAIVEECYAQALDTLRRGFEAQRPMATAMAERLVQARARLERRRRTPRTGVPAGLDAVCALATSAPHAAETPGGVLTAAPPPNLALEPGSRTTLRDELGRVFNHFNRGTAGSVVVAAADLLASTSVLRIADGFASGYYHRRRNPESRVLAAGGICEDAMAGMLSGIAAFGRHLGVGASYGAFNAPLGHVAARLHAIGCQARNATDGTPFQPFVLVCAHAGLKTGEDGPTHADPQSLQLLQGNFPSGTLITLTPWDPQEIWPLVAAALARRPAVIAPFVTRPPETVLDRSALGLAPAAHAADGVYALRRARGARAGTVVLQGCGVTNVFLDSVLPRLVAEGLELDVYYVASAELFDLLPGPQREAIFPSERGLEAIGITDFTLPTMDRWVRSDRGRRHSLHPFRAGHFLGSGPGAVVMAEAGLDGDSQLRAIRSYVKGD